MTKQTITEALAELTDDQAETNVRLHEKWEQYDENTILGVDDEGWEYAHNLADGMWWRITPCCGASDKGLEDGVGCRACYGWIPDEVSWPVMLGGKDVPLFGGEYAPGQSFTEVTS